MANVEATTDLRRGETSLLDFSFGVPAIGVLLFAGLLLRLALAALSGFDVDITLFRSWSERLAADGPWDFYDNDFFTDYAPGYMYLLLLIGEFNQLLGRLDSLPLIAQFSDDQWEYVLKLPAIFADLACAYVLYRLLDAQRMVVRLAAVTLWLVFPATLLIGPIWGQVDSFLSFFLLLSIYYISRDRPVRGAVAFTLGFLVKPQAIAALPFLALWIMRRHPPAWMKGETGPLVPHLWLRITGICLGIVFVVILPFFTYQPWNFIEHLYSATDVPNYRVNSFWAYNFWNIEGLFDGGFQPDDQTFLGITNRIWGVVMFAIAIGAVIAATWRARGAGMLALGVALSIFAFYLFLTRMHERYVFPAILPMLAACVLLGASVARDRLPEARDVMTLTAGAVLSVVGFLLLGFAFGDAFFFLTVLPVLVVLAYAFTRTMLWATFLALGTLHFINLYHVFTYDLYNEDGPNSLKVDRFYAWLGSGDFLGMGYETVQVFSFLMVLLFPVGLALAGFLSERSASRDQPA